jgi:PAS domain S-box-containing protein
MFNRPTMILAIDDEAGIRAQIKEFLEMNGNNKVDAVGSVQEARAAIAKQSYDAIVSDYKMPGEDGIEFLKELRAAGNSIPFILLTGKGREDVVIEAFESGADAYLQKGGEPKSLFAELDHRISSIVRRHRAEAALLDSEAEFRSLFEDNPDAVSLVDLEGKVLNTNQAAADMVMMRKEDIIGRTYADLGVFSEEDLALFRRSTRSLVKGHPVSPITVMVRRKDGSVRWVEIRASLVTKQGRSLATQIIARDITTRMQAEEALRQANKKLNLLSSITRHDIDNQLTVLRGNLALLRNTQLEPSSIEYVRKVESAAERISAMIRFTKTYEDIGVNAPVWSEVRAIAAKAIGQVPQGAVKVINDIPAGLEIFADPLILKVFYNLTDNAVRYGRSISKIHFSADDNDGVVTIICEDDGVGVTKDLKETLFSTGSSREHGMGLFLSMEILSITDITLAEVGQPGHGAKFVLTVPKRGSRMKGTSGCNESA